jgi:pimeloyl-ACP methyl ester carboxylesterase
MGNPADLVAMTEDIVPCGFVLVAHSMGEMVARRAAERLGSRLRGLLLVDPTQETAPVYNAIAQFARKADRMMAVSQALTRFRPLARLFTRNVQRLFPPTHTRHARRGLQPGRNRPDPQGFQAVAAAAAPSSWRP